MLRLAVGDVIPDPDEGEEDEVICAQGWEKIRVAQNVKGENKPKSTGGGMPRTRNHPQLVKATTGLCDDGVGIVITV